MSIGAFIEHRGVVKKINGTTVTVTIISSSACAACHTKGGCPASESQEKQISVTTSDASAYHPGEPVILRIAQQSGMIALMLGYVVPCVIMVLTLFLVYQVTHSESIAGLSAVGILLPYYGSLYFLKSWLKNVCSINLRKDQAPL